MQDVNDIIVRLETAFEKQSQEIHDSAIEDLTTLVNTLEDEFDRISTELDAAQDEISDLYGQIDDLQQELEKR